MEERPNYELGAPEFDRRTYDEDQGLARFIRRCKENPTLPLGMAAFIGIGIYGAFKFRTTKERPSIFLIQLRVAAQGTAIGLLTLGAFHHFYTRELRPKLEGKKST